MVLAVVGSLVAIAATPAAAFLAQRCATSSGNPMVDFDLQSAYPGQTIHGNGSGFPNGAAVVVTINGVPLTSSIQVVTGTEQTPYNWGNGTFDGYFVIPDVPAGNYSGAATLITSAGGLSACASWFQVNPKVTLSKSTAGVGDSVTIAGHGFTYPGSALASLYQSDGATSAGPLITSPQSIPVTSNGTLSATFTMPSPFPKDGAGNYSVRVTDSAGKMANASILITPSIQLIPNSGLPGQNFTIQGSDFPLATTGANLYWQTAYPGNTSIPARVDPMVSNGFITGWTIPSAAVSGQYYVWAVQGADPTTPTSLNSAKALMTVGALTLTLTPSSANPGSVVTLQGSGFTNTGTAHLATVMFGATCAPITGPNTIPPSGTITTTIVVPPLNPGTYTVVASDDAAIPVIRTGSWVVAAPTITLTPSAGPPNQLLQITGSGWIPTTNAVSNALTGTVSITVAGGTPLTAPVAANGMFSVTTLVPAGLSAGPQTVLASESGVNAVTSSLWGCTFAAPTSFSTVGTFTVTQGSLSLTPKQGIPGDTVTFTGGGFPAYTQINQIQFTSPTGTIAITPVPAPQVNASGVATGTFTVPASIAGTATVVVWSGWGGATPAAGAATFNVMSGAATPAAVFASLITNNQLTKPVWSFDNVSKTWKMYDPNDLPDSNIPTLTAGTIYCLYVNATVSLNWGINSYSLTPGWNCIGWLG